jgi:hypothetical protein
MSSEIKWIYVSGPYTKGDTVIHVRNAIEAGMRLRESGFVPIIPHLFHFAHLIDPQDYRYWMDWDMELLARCDAIIRLPGESSGADEEVAWMEEHGRLVYICRNDLGVIEGVDQFLLLLEVE